MADAVTFGAVVSFITEQQLFRRGSSRVELSVCAQVVNAPIVIGGIDWSGYEVDFAIIFFWSNRHSLENNLAPHAQDRMSCLMAACLPEIV